MNLKLVKQHDQVLSLNHANNELIELESNASKFAVFSAVRSSVLEAETKYSQIFATTEQNGKLALLPSCCCHCAATCKTGAIVDCRCHQNNSKQQDNNDSENETYTEDSTEKEVILQVPQVIVLVYKLDFL